MLGMDVVARLTVSPRVVRRNGREYIEYWAYIPKAVARRLYELAGARFEDGSVRLVVSARLEPVKPVPDNAASRVVAYRLTDFVSASG